MRSARKAVTVAMIAGLLIGCVTTQSAQTAAPTIAADSRQSPDQVRECILKGHLSVSDYFGAPVPPPQVMPFNGGTRIIFMNDQRQFVDLTPIASGTHIRYVRKLIATKGVAMIERVVRTCAGA